MSPAVTIAKEMPLVWRGPGLDRYRLAMGAGLVALGVLSVLHILFGSVDLSASDVLAALVGKQSDIVHHQIVVLLRLPRVIVAALAGAMLGLSGAILQTITRNPLAEPGLMGVTSGAVLAIVLWTVAGGPALFGAEGAAASLSLPLVGVLGGMAAGSLTYALALTRILGADPIRLILMGVIVSAMAGSFAGLLMLGASDASLREILFWTVGSTNGRVWVHVETILPFAVLGLAAGLASTRLSNLLHLGDGVARGLGSWVEPVRFALLFVASALTAGAVSVVGGIGFIGLVGPHMARMIAGNDARRLFPLAAVLSALLLVVADLVARTAQLGILTTGLGLDLPGTTGLPVGAVTACLGVPFFLYLVLRRSASDG